jgi:tRNA-dihydrouridine synthase
MLHAEPVSFEERFRVVIEHCEHFERLSGVARFVAMRKHLTWYCRSFRGAAEMRARMTRASSAADVRRCMAEFMSSARDEASRARASMPVDEFRSLEIFPAT